MAPKSAHALPAGELPILANPQKFFLTNARLNAQAYRAGLQIQIEMLDFMRHRCEQDAKLVDDLFRTEELTGAFDVLSEFMQNTAKEYATEASKLATISSNIGADTARRAGQSKDAWTGDGSATTAN